MDVGIIVALIQALAALGPQIPELVTAVETAVGLLQTGQAPTAAQQAQIDAGLDAANKALQAS